MRTKLFLAFFAVMLTALVSNLIFENLILGDFDDYLKGTNEDRIYWVLASVEGGMEGGSWNMGRLRDSVHWAMMLGLDVVVKDVAAKEIINSKEVFRLLPESMKRRMEGIVRLGDSKEGFEEYPLFLKGEEIGSLLVRPLPSGGPAAKGKELAFKKRGRDFLVISFIIAGGGAFFLSLIFSLFLTRPVMRLKRAAEAVANGDLDVKVAVSGGDEIGRLTETFNDMVDALKRQELVRRHLASNIAHELRTPLAVMRANVEAMTDGVITDAEEGLERIGAEIKRLTGLIEAIEDITKAEAGFFSKVRYEEVDVGEFLTGMAEGMRALFAEKGLSVSLLPGGEVLAETDGEKLENVLRNLLANSLKHTKEGGVKISFGPMGREFYISVSDTGEGIAEAELPHVFDRFFKGGASGGAGLGLAISKELVEAMGGHIEAKSSPGKGSTFTVRLPKRR